MVTLMTRPRYYGVTGWMQCWSVLFLFSSITHKLKCFQGKLSRAMKAQPDHPDAYTIVHDLCTSSIAQIEAALTEQRRVEAADAKRKEEEAQAKVEMARLEAEREAKEMQEKVDRIENDRLEIEAAERQLQLRKQALHDAQKDAAAGKGVDEDEEEEEQEEDGDEIESSTEGQTVCIPSRYAIFYNVPVLGECQNAGKASTGVGYPSKAAPNASRQCELYYLIGI
jgi:hypothetical protein